jgi:hypothetical protein
MRALITILFLHICLISIAQQTKIDPDLLQIKQRLDSMAGFTADMSLEVDVNFINMPKKKGTLIYRKGVPAKILTDDFMLVPKRGLDFTLEQLFKYPFITVPRGSQVRNGDSLKVINVIPTSDKADFSIAELTLNISKNRIAQSKISTLRDGSYDVFFSYTDATSILPRQIKIQFEVERIRIPLSFLGQDVKVDRKLKRSEDIKKGTITLDISNYREKR